MVKGHLLTRYPQRDIGNVLHDRRLPGLKVTQVGLDFAQVELDALLPGLKSLQVLQQQVLNVFGDRESSWMCSQCASKLIREQAEERTFCG